MAYKVIDVSEHQGTIDWNAVKGNIDGAIIRCGYGDDISSQDDKQFQDIICRIRYISILRNRERRTGLSAALIYLEILLRLPGTRAEYMQIQIGGQTTWWDLSALRSG